MIDSSTDCHCHILPGLDDGARTLEESVALARRQAYWGFRKVVCTSHRVGKYPNVPEVVVAACNMLQEELRRRKIPLELTPSMEYRLIPETWPETLEKGWHHGGCHRGDFRDDPCQGDDPERRRSPGHGPN